MDNTLPEVRFGVAGLQVKNMSDCLASTDDFIREMSAALEVEMSSDDVYKTYKDCRKALKDHRKEIDDMRKEAVKSVKADFEKDMKAITEKYDLAISKFDDAIRSYEEEYNIGAAKAKATRDANKAAKEAEFDAMTLVIHCLNAESKERIAQFAKDLGATIE